jgi:cell division protein FtsB
MIMAGVLEAGKLVMTSFLYRYWDRVPRMLKIYSTAAVITLVGITSLGIYGFLSDAYDDTRAKVEMHEHNIEQIVKENEHIEAEMVSLKSSSDTVDEKSTETIAGFQKIYDNFVSDRRERQTSLSDRHKTDTEARSTRRQQLLDRLAILDKARSDLEASSGGLFSNKKKKLEELAKSQASERASIVESMKKIDDEESTAITSYDQQKED